MSRFEVASSTFAKLAGLFAFGPDEDVLLLLADCCDIHTAGMRAAIDAAFVDAQGRVVESVRCVGAWRRLKCPGAAAVLERYADPYAAWPAPGSQVGDLFPEAERVLACTRRKGGEGKHGERNHRRRSHHG